MNDLRILFIGSCQVAGMGATANKLLPNAKIDSQHIFATIQPEDASEYVKNFDIVVTQIAEDDERMPHIRASVLNSPALKAVYLPTFVFTGLHPDMTYIMEDHKIIPGAHSDVHSTIAAACFLLGMDGTRAAKLFNKYVFSELGYLEQYQISHRFMIETFESAGYDAYGLVERVLADSNSFMHTMNHPAISIISELTTQALKRAGVISSDVAAPADVPDSLFNSFVAPVFPPIAQMIGINGSATYLKPNHPSESREIELDEYIDLSYRIYKNIDRNVIAQNSILNAANTIKSIIR